MEYYYFREDKYNNIHSIDNVIITYFLTCTLDFALGHIKMISDCSSNYWEKLNVSRCSRYSYFNNIIHFDDGIYLKLGKYGMWLEDSKKFELLPKFQLEVNPNKHFKKDSFKRIIDFIEHYCSSGNLDKYDYAIDFPGKSVDDIQIFSSRKEKGLYKGTKYRGQRNKNGYCKIYDKGKEQKIDDIITRVEHTCVRNCALSFEKLFISDSGNAADLSNISASRRLLVKSIIRLRENGIEYQDLLDELDRATKMRIMPYISNTNYTVYEYDLNILDDLLSHMSVLFHFDYTDSNGLMMFDDTLEDLPFD